MNLEWKLEKALKECERLKEENRLLKKILANHHINYSFDNENQLFF